MQSGVRKVQPFTTEFPEAAQKLFSQGTGKAFHRQIYFLLSVQTLNAVQGAICYGFFCLSSTLCSPHPLPSGSFLKQRGENSGRTVAAASPLLYPCHCIRKFSFLGCCLPEEKAARLLRSRCLQICISVLATLSAVLTALLIAVQSGYCAFFLSVCLFKKEKKRDARLLLHKWSLYFFYRNRLSQFFQVMGKQPLCGVQKTGLGLFSGMLLISSIQKKMLPNTFVCLNLCEPTAVSDLKGEKVPALWWCSAAAGGLRGRHGCRQGRVQSCAAALPLSS